jgi:iron complex outermembrane recepter protein
VILGLSVARAADPRLGEVVVTAPREREPQAPGDPTAFATVIDTTTAPSTVETLGEVLAESVGVQVRRFGGLGDFSTVSIRGSAAGQVQVYLDGVPLSRAENEVVNLNDLPLDAIDHVEVYRGTTPLGFAQSGPGGVVNVVTRRPGDTPLTGASVSGGSFDTRKVDLARAATVGPWEYLAFAHYLGSAGDFRFINDLGTTANPADDREETRRNNDFNLGNLTARLGYHGLGPATFALVSDTVAKDEGVPGVGSVQADDTSLRTLRQVAHLDMTVPPPPTLPVGLEASSYVLYQDQRFSDPKGEIALVPEDVTQETTAGGLQVLLRGALGAHQAPGLFLAGSDERFAQHNHLAPTSPGVSTRVRGTIAGEDQIWFFADRLSFVPGLRWEIFRDDFAGSAGPPATPASNQVRDFFSPHLGMRAGPMSGLTLLGNVGRYAREPNLEELFGNQGVVIGNPRLRPEVALNGDIGFRLEPPDLGRLITRVAFQYAYFNNTIDDLIVLVQNSQNIVQPQNVTQAHVTGHELVLRGRFAERLGLIANYTHEDARDVGDVPFLHGKQLPGRPADEAYARLELDWSRTHPLPFHGAARLWPGRVFFDVNLIADNFLDRANVRHVAERTIFGVGAEVALPLPGVRLALEAKNVGDDQTRDALGFPLPGRALFVTLSYGFGAKVDAR